MALTRERASWSLPTSMVTTRRISKSSCTRRSRTFTSKHRISCSKPGRQRRIGGEAQSRASNPFSRSPGRSGAGEQLFGADEQDWGGRRSISLVASHRCRPGMRIIRTPTGPLGLSLTHGFQGGNLSSESRNVSPARKARKGRVGKESPAQTGGAMVQDGRGCETSVLGSSRDLDNIAEKEIDVPV